MAEKRVQRRLAAILAVDVVGYSRLRREDETGSLAQLKTLRKEVFDLPPGWRQSFWTHGPRPAAHRERTWALKPTV